MVIVLVISSIFYEGCFLVGIKLNIKYIVFLLVKRKYIVIEMRRVVSYKGGREGFLIFGIIVWYEEGELYGCLGSILGKGSVMGLELVLFCYFEWSSGGFFLEEKVWLFILNRIFC